MKVKQHPSFFALFSLGPYSAKNLILVLLLNSYSLQAWKVSLQSLLLSRGLQLCSALILGNYKRIPLVTHSYSRKKSKLSIETLEQTLLYESLATQFSHRKSTFVHIFYVKFNFGDLIGNFVPPKASHPDSAYLWGNRELGSKMVEAIVAYQLCYTIHFYLTCSVRYELLCKEGMVCREFWYRSGWYKYMFYLTVWTCSVSLLTACLLTLRTFHPSVSFYWMKWCRVLRTNCSLQRS